ncbi:hypothetical protein Anapl_02813 [Anas platyrhynchos]|uniref:Uncharacterized protein n=1 Tax=Anas platyrhynchos TaxID=8839 RepID=R0LSB3_ANAPL|nr:hypothetical protein Anapl_02813 [Anas platyrhynchos]
MVPVAFGSASLVLASSLTSLNAPQSHRGKADLLAASLPRQPCLNHLWGLINFNPRDKNVTDFGSTCQTSDHKNVKAGSCFQSERLDMNMNGVQETSHRLSDYYRSLQDLPFWLMKVKMKQWIKGKYQQKQIYMSFSSCKAFSFKRHSKVDNLILPDKHSCWWEALFPWELLICHLAVAKFIRGFEYQYSIIDLDIVFSREASEWRGQANCSEKLIQKVAGNGHMRAGEKLKLREANPCPQLPLAGFFKYIQMHRTERKCLLIRPKRRKIYSIYLPFTVEKLPLQQTSLLGVASSRGGYCAEQRTNILKKDQAGEEFVEHSFAKLSGFVWDCLARERLDTTSIAVLTFILLINKQTNKERKQDKKNIARNREIAFSNKEQPLSHNDKAFQKSLLLANCFYLYGYNVIPEAAEKASTEHLKNNYITRDEIYSSRTPKSRAKIHPAGLKVSKLEASIPKLFRQSVLEDTRKRLASGLWNPLQILTSLQELVTPG